MEPRATPCIALVENKDQDGLYLMSLETGQRFHSRRWEQLPITDSVIDRVNTITKNQPTMLNNQPISEWSPGLTIDDDELLFDDNDLLSDDSSLDD